MPSRGSVWTADEWRETKVWRISSKKLSIKKITPRHISTVLGEEERESTSAWDFAFSHTQGQYTDYSFIIRIRV